MNPTRRHQPRSEPGRDHPHDHDDDHDHDHDDHGGHGGRGRLGGWTHLFTPHSHDAADSVDDELEGSTEGIRAVKISLVVLSLTAVAQLAVVFVTGSAALLADTIHNFSDALTALPLWVAFVLSRRSATRRYTYGYGRAEDLAGIFIVVMIALSALVAGWESIDRLLSGSTVTYPWVVAGAGVIGFVGNELVAVYRIKVGRRIGSAALVADGLHARTDGFASLAVVAGAAGVLLGFPIADPVVGIMITVAILVMLRGAARDVFRRLMDGVDPASTRTAEKIAAAAPGVVGVGRLRLRWSGHRLSADVVVWVRPDLSLGAALEIADGVRDRLVGGVPKLSEVTVVLGSGPGSAPVQPAGGRAGAEDVGRRA